MGSETNGAARAELIQSINLKLAWLGCPTVQSTGMQMVEMAAGLLAHHREIQRLLADHLNPADGRLRDFLRRFFAPHPCAECLPAQTLVLDRRGLARALSLPVDADQFHSPLVDSYRVAQGVLHNPRSDRRTTEGSFHVAEGGLPIPDDKVAVPREVAAQLTAAAFSPPAELMALPFTSTQPDPAQCWVSLHLRPTVCPGVPGVLPERSMEIRLFAPGSLVGNLDFVESIFGNAGDPLLPENDAGLDVEHWTGHSGCVVLAPHLTSLTKKALGLPSWDDATERQRRDRMCWRQEGERYNDGAGFKLAIRDSSGVMVTLIADNYFGYCKKEVKTQLAFAANLFGLAEEEHAGGALVFSSYDLGEDFCSKRTLAAGEEGLSEVLRLLGDTIDLHPDGYAVDRRWPEVFFVPEHARFDLHRQSVVWSQGTAERKLKLLPERTYVLPSGFRVVMVKPPGGRAWRLIGTPASALSCHKPSTVSGGGKSEISKPITDAILQGPVFVADFQHDLDRVEALLTRDYSSRFRTPRLPLDRRPILSEKRSLGSVIKLLTPSSEYTDSFNGWLESVDQHIKELVFVLKRFYRPEWGERWRDHFSVDIINGVPGNELKLHNRKLASAYLRVGYAPDGLWRTFGLRKDFYPAAKLALEDDITVSVVVPQRKLGGSNEVTAPSVKLVHNCETRLFQRPDDAIHRGQDRQTEADFARSGLFFSNYEPLSPAHADEILEDAIGFLQYTEPMQQFLRTARDERPRWFVCPAYPRLVEGKPTKNPRYLQDRPDLAQPRNRYLAEVAQRLKRKVPFSQPLLSPVNAVLPGRRNNPPDPAARIRSLAVFNPIHYLELPEAFLEFICSLTGKSPSTTGVGSEGALTKGPFNALLPIIDLNDALVSYLLTGYQVFVTAAGYVGPKVRVDHDISLLVPELWCRMSPQERDSRHLIEHGYLERCQDFQHEGQTVQASRLGWRITSRFVTTFFGKVFNHPNVVITDEMLRPESQSPAIFADGIDNIISTQRQVALRYFADGSVDLACPPLRALLHVMRDGHWQGHGLAAPELRRLFTPEHLFASDWYRERLVHKQVVDTRLWTRHVQYIEAFLQRKSHAREAARMRLAERLVLARETLSHVQSPTYLDDLHGTIGASPLSVAAPAGGPR